MAEIRATITTSIDAPLVTVAMPIYNAGAYLRQAVISIVRQTFDDWELLIIDDGSTDNALESIGDLCDSRIRILHDGKNLGLAARLNQAIELASGRYLARMDQDDISYPNRFSKQVIALESCPHIDLLATRALIIDENDVVTGLFPYRVAHREICARPWAGFYFPHPTWMGKIEWFRRHRYAQPAPYLCEDQELLLRTYSTSNFATLDEILFAYRIRKKADYLKLKNTRYSLKAMQVQYFLEACQLNHLLLSKVIFFCRRIVDRFKYAMPDSREKRKVVDSYIVKQWQKVLDYLNGRA